MEHSLAQFGHHNSKKMGYKCCLSFECFLMTISAVAGHVCFILSLFLLAGGAALIYYKGKVQNFIESNQDLLEAYTNINISGYNLMVYYDLVIFLCFLLSSLEFVRYIDNTRRSCRRPTVENNEKEFKRLLELDRLQGKPIVASTGYRSPV